MLIMQRPDDRETRSYHPRDRRLLRALGLAGLILAGSTVAGVAGGVTAGFTMRYLDQADRQARMSDACDEGLLESVGASVQNGGEVQQGEVLEFEASSNCGPEAEYQWWLQRSSGSWEVAKKWGPEKKFSIDAAGLNEGEHAAGFWARRAAKARRSDGNDVFQNANEFHFSVRSYTPR